MIKLIALLWGINCIGWLFYFIEDMVKGEPFKLDLILVMGSMILLNQFIEKEKGEQNEK